TVAPGSSVSIPVLANDSDPDQAPLTITQVGTPGHGVAHLNPADHTIIYTPAAGFTGTDTFTYTVADPAGVEATATVTVTVTPAQSSGIPISHILPVVVHADIYGPHPNASADEAFIRGLYRMILDRDAAPSEVAAYVQALDGGAVTHKQM